MSSHRKYYAVRIGRDGPQIYDNYAEVIRPCSGTHGFSGSSGKGFDNIRDAQAWLAGYPFAHVTTTHTRTNISVTWNLSNGADCLHSEGVASTSTSSTTTTLVTQPLTEDQRSRRAEDEQMNRENWHGCPTPGHSINGDRQEPHVPPQLPPDSVVKLSEEQKNILKMVKGGKNVLGSRCYFELSLATCVVYMI
ncbi:hypothetical protein F5I97DRAFT_1620266 [Phlebopus sp. FC_14]|nr:hypothetical protein F5I97DRAFT_1620266 [Phlebopus sp. FC_14]